MPKQIAHRAARRGGEENPRKLEANIRKRGARAEHTIERFTPPQPPPSLCERADPDDADECGGVRFGSVRSIPVGSGRVVRWGQSGSGHRGKGNGRDTERNGMDGMDGRGQTETDAGASARVNKAQAQ